MIRETRVEKTGGTVGDFTDYFNDRFRRLKEVIGSGRAGMLSGMVNSIESINQYTSGREVSVVGIVYDKIMTRNGHVLATLEDESGVAKVLFPKVEGGKGRELFESARSLMTEDVVAVKGKISGQLIIANSVVWPDVPIRNRKPAGEDVAIAFASDTQVGSKLFLEKQFGNMLKWLNGGLDYKKDLAGKVKYLIINGDVVDGVGVYPSQEKDLAIPDIYKQYKVFFEFMSTIPDYIEVFVLPGNHDAVQRAEPQPAIPKDLVGDFDRENVHMISNPSYLKLHGISVLAYHGTSLDSVIQSVPNCSYSRPETAMTEILKRRHLSPIYGGNIVVPSSRDAMVIDEVPDILHMGHVHKNAAGEHHGTLLINSGTWQGRTAYQIKQGHIPTPALLPVYETKSMILSNVDFNNIQQ